MGHDDNRLMLSGRSKSADDLSGLSGAPFCEVTDQMRLDKFLKVARVIKRRTLAKEACDRGQVTVNGHVAKAGTELKPQDVVGITFGRRKLVIRVLELRESVPAALSAGLYEVLEDVWKEEV